MHVHLTLRRRGLPDREIAVDAPRGTALAELDSYLTDDMSPAQQGWWAGSRRLGLETHVGGPGLRDGDVVGVGQVGERDRLGGAVLLLHAVGGLDAGGIWPLPAGMLIVGRAEDADVRLCDADVSRRHATVTVTAAGVYLRDLDSTNGTTIDGEPVRDAGALLRPGQLIQMGNSVLSIASTPDAPAVLRPDGAARLMLNRSPRVGARLLPRTVEYPAESVQAARTPLRLAATVLPALVCVALAWWLRSPLMLVFAALSPLAMLAGALSDRLHARRGRARTARAMRVLEHEANQRRDALLGEEVGHRRRAHPDPAALRVIAQTPTSRLWERHRGDPDVLDIRIGLGRAPAALQLLRDGTSMPAPLLDSVPRLANLREGALGIAGPPAASLAAARSAVLQIATLHSPADVRLVVVLGESTAPHWRWLRWLPHVSDVAADSASRRTLIDRLAALVEDRTRHAAGDTAPWPAEWTVVIIDRPQVVADSPAMARVLRDGPAVGVTAMCVEDAAHLLPSLCAHLLSIESDHSGRAVLRRTRASASASVRADGVRHRHAEDVARALAPLIDPTDERSALPNSVGLLDILELRDVDAARVGEQWQRYGGTPRAVLGQSIHGAVSIDLIGDGPHALIAGTTGAGKSELLQTLIASLAIQLPPEDLAFVLVDYKGGAAFAQCAALPHTAGLVTDLDSAMAERALRSLHAELRRREQALAAQGAAEFAQLRRDSREPLPRLVLVVDEFAALAQEQPEFLSGLVGIAQRGRSLGVHLVLATQRPSGVVSAEIRANMNLRIALRVNDPAESRDIIGVDSAARIPRDVPGRAYLQLGAAGEWPIQVQTARIGGAWEPAATIRVRPLDEWRRLSADAPTVDQPLHPDQPYTDLQVLVAAIAAAGEARARPLPPWREPLPTLLAASSPALAAATSPGRVALGLIDRPDAQSQEPWTVDLAAGETVLLVGSAKSGRTSALRTVAFAALLDRTERADPTTADGIEIHVLDCAGGELAALSTDARCGIYVDEASADAVRSAVARLAKLVSLRRARSDSRGCLVLIDGIDAAAALAEQAEPGRGADQLLAVLRDAASAHITVVAAGDRPALVGRLAATFATKVLLRLNDPADYALTGVPLRIAPVNPNPGRGILVPSGDQVQLAVIGDGSPETQDHALHSTLCQLAVAGPTVRFRALPRLVEPPMTAPSGASDLPRGTVLLGVGGDDAEPVSWPVFEHPARLLIVGPPGSGRSTALALISHQLRRQGFGVLVLDARVAALNMHGTVPNVGPDGGGECLAPQAIVVPDCRSIQDSPIGQQLAKLERERPDIAIIAAGGIDELATSFHGIGPQLLKHRRGILLCPGPTDPDVFSLRLPRTRPEFIPGRGFLIGPQPPVAIQLAQSSPISENRHPAL